MMHALYKLLLFYLLTCLGGSALGSDIIKGKKTKQKSMLYMASVQNRSGHVCGGFLIKEDFVVTAAHCANMNLTSVVLGTHNLRKVDETMRYTVKCMCKYPSYKEPESGNDIMLLKLSRKARMGKKQPIKPVQLPSSKMKLKDKKKCHVAGWGLTKTHGDVVDDLREADVPIINLAKCQKAWNPRILPANIICAGGYDTKKGFCQGDSGGPLVCGKEVVGVASFNNKSNCDYPDKPNIYTDVSKFLPWINEILEKKIC